VGTHRASLSTGTRENWLRNERERRRKLHAIVHAIRRQSIIIARKRSAVVSIFFTDVPFLAVRLWVYMVLGHGGLHGSMFKNGLCILLNVMQYTLVRLASAESSRDIQEQLAEYIVRFAAADVDTAVLQDTPSEEARRKMSTPEGRDAELKRARLIKAARQAAEKEVQQGSVRSHAVCGYAMAMVLPFMAGLLLARGEGFILFVLEQLRGLVVVEETST